MYNPDVLDPLKHPAVVGIPEGCYDQGKGNRLGFCEAPFLFGKICDLRVHFFIQDLAHLIVIVRPLQRFQLRLQTIAFI